MILITDRKERNMKKRAILLILAAASIALLNGCQKEDTTEKYAKYVTLGDYKDLSVERVVYTVTEESVEAEIENLLYSYAESTPVTDRAARKGDLVNIDYSGTIDGEAFDGGSESDCEVELGSDSFIEGFEDQIAGMKTGETKEFSLTFPEPYDGELDGKEAVFSVTVNEIQETELPVLDDAFVKANTEYTSVDDLKKGLREELEASNKEESDDTAAYDALYMVIDNSTVGGYPEEVYQEALDEITASNNQIAEMFGISVEELYGEDYDPDSAALDYLTEKLVVYAIAEKENLSVSDEEYQTYIEEYYPLYGYETQEEYEKDYSPESTKYELLYEKVLSFLLDHSTVIDIPEEEYFDEDFEEADLLSEEDLLTEEPVANEEETLTEVESVSEDE